MKILVISLTNIESDVRVKRHINTLTSYFQVDSCGFGKKPMGISTHFELPKHLKYLPTNLNSIFFHLLGIYSESYKRSQVIKWMISNLKNEINKYDLIICNDVLTIGVPSLLDFKKSTYADLHEYSPKEFEDDFRFRIFLKRYYEYLCKTYLKNFDLVTSVSSTIAKEYSRNFDVYCHVLTNSKPFYSSIQIKKTNANKIKLVHAGLAVKNRNLRLLIKAFESIDGIELDLYLVKSHRQPYEFKKIKKLAQKSRNIKVLNPIPNDYLIETLSNYDVGIAFFPDKTFNLRYGLGNKLFEYIQARLCIIVGPSPDMANIVNSYSLGLVVQSFNSEDLMRAIQSIKSEKIDLYKQNVNRAAFALSYDAEKDIYINKIFEAISKNKTSD